MAAIPKAVPRTVPAIRPRLEVWLWAFMRISGVLLIPLAFGHLAIMHIINNVHDINACFVYYRWNVLFWWRVYDALLLFLAYIHGLNGLRHVIDDYVHHQGWNRALNWIAFIGGSLVILVGAIALIGGVRVTALPQGCPPIS
jgi:succinate dehydrogenase / fumarate reductase membrane anchor subunit